MTNSCRICGAPIAPFMSFGEQPIANGFLPQSEFAREYFFEMAVCFCEACTMFQLLEQPAPEQMFHEHYAFFSGTSRLMTEHFRLFAEEVIANHLPKENPFVVEIGSNDGIMLQNFKAQGIRHLGIEPSANVAAVAREKGINTVSKFFSKETAKEIVAEHGHADAFLAANCMCHIPTFRSVVAGIAELLSDNGVAIFEDPYLGDVIENTSYDQIYDEHVFLFSLSSIRRAFSEYGLEVFDVAPQETHGGSMRFYIGRQGRRAPSTRVQELEAREDRIGLQHKGTYLKFKSNVEHSRSELVRVLKEFKAAGKRVVGYAATSKSTTILNYCKIGPELIDYISDTTPIKQGKFSPGMHIPVRAYEEFQRSHPEAALLFAYNHQKEIFAKEKEYHGQWILFVPEVHIR